MTVVDNSVVFDALLGRLRPEQLGDGALVALGMPLLTTDARLARAPGVRCLVDVL